MNREQETAEEKLPSGRKHKNGYAFLCGLLHDLRHRHKTPAAMEAAPRAWRSSLFPHVFREISGKVLDFFRKRMYSKRYHGFDGRLVQLVRTHPSHG